MTSFEINNEAVEANILKILMSKPDENISQNNIYERLVEIYTVSDNKPNTRSKNNKLKNLLKKYISSRNNDGVVSIISEGNLFLKYVSVEDNTENNEDYYLTDDDIDDIEDIEDIEDIDDIDDIEDIQDNENNKNNKDFYEDFFDSLVININKNKKFIKKYRDVNGATISHHVVRNPKYKKIIKELIEQNLFYFYKRDKLGFTPLHYCCESLKTDITLEYIKEIELEFVNTEKYLKDEINILNKKVDYTEITARNADYKISFLIGLFFLLLLNMFLKEQLF